MRRRWSLAQFASAVAREAGIHASKLYRWRQELCGPARAAPGFAAVTIAPEAGVAARTAIAAPHGVIEIELAREWRPTPITFVLPWRRPAP